MPRDLREAECSICGEPMTGEFSWTAVCEECGEEAEDERGRWEEMCWQEEREMELWADE